MGELQPDPSSARGAYDEFLERFWADFDEGKVGSVGHYQALFPSAAAQVALEYATLLSVSRPGGHDRESATTAFAELFLRDHENGQTAAVARYQRLFSGFEDVVAVEYRRLAALVRPVRVTADGRRFLGEYELLSKLGEGGMGVVYLAHSVGSEPLALKLVRTRLLADSDVVRRFRREVRIASGLDHPNVVAILDSGRLGGQYFIASEFLEGGGLDGILRTGPLSPRSALAVTRDVLGGLGAIHAAGLVHRDVKPANILLTSSGVARLGDLGLARSVAPDRNVYTTTDAFLGTIAYASPEQLTGARDIDIRSDLYAVGVTLFTCLTGALPYRATSVPEMIDMQCSAPVPDPRERDASLGTGLALLAFQLLAKSRDDRPSSPAAALALVDDALAATAPEQAGETLADRVAQSAASTRVARALTEPVRDTLFVTFGARTAALSRRATQDGGSRAEARAPSILLTDDGVGAASGGSRARLESRRDGRTQVLEIHGGRTLTFGRSRGDRGVDVALPLQARPEGVELSQRVSAAHFVIAVDGARVTIADCGSTGGTRANGETLRAHEPVTLMARNETEVARSLNLVVRTVTPATPPPIEIPGAGRADEALPAVLVEEMDEHADLAHVLVPFAFSLSLEVEVVFVGGRLWLREVAAGRASCRLLAPGLEIETPAASWEVVVT